MSIQEVGAPDAPVVIYNELVAKYGYDPLTDTTFADLLPAVAVSAVDAAVIAGGTGKAVAAWQSAVEVYTAAGDGAQVEQVTVTEAEVPLAVSEPVTDAVEAPVEPAAPAEALVPVDYLVPAAYEAPDGYEAPEVYPAPIEEADAYPVEMVEDVATPVAVEVAEPVAIDMLAEYEMPEFIDVPVAVEAVEEFDGPADYGVVLGDETTAEAPSASAQSCDETREVINTHYIVLPE